MNRREEEAEGQKLKTRTGIIEFSELIYERGKQSGPRITWFVLHKTYCMYIDADNKEEMNAAMLITSIAEH